MPSCEAPASLQPQQQSGQRAHDDRAERESDVEAADRARTLPRRKPSRKIVDDAGKETCLCDAESKTHRIKLNWRLHQHHSHREQSPREHDPGQPAARAETHQQKIGRHLAGPVAEKKESRTKEIDRCAEVQVMIHLQRGEADVDAIHVGDAIAHRYQRQQSQAGFAQRGAAYRLLILFR